MRRRSIVEVAMSNARDNGPKTMSSTDGMSRCLSMMCGNDELVPFRVRVCWKRGEKKR